MAAHVPPAATMKSGGAVVPVVAPCTTTVGAAESPAYAIVTVTVSAVDWPTAVVPGKATGVWNCACTTAAFITAVSKTKAVRKIRLLMGEVVLDDAWERWGKSGPVYLKEVLR